MKRVIKGENDLKTKAPEIAAEWDFGQNSGFPEDYFYGSTERVNWICSVCGHKWNTKIRYRAENRKSGCPVCGRAKRGKT